MIWHYSSHKVIEAIASGSAYLKPSAAGGGDNEASLLWFSTNQYWEPTATKLCLTETGEIKQLSFDEQHSGFGCVRLGLSIATTKHKFMSFKDACKAAGISSTDQQNMLTEARRQGANPHKQYRATLEPIPFDSLLVEVLDRDKCWVRLTAAA